MHATARLAGLAVLVLLACSEEDQGTPSSDAAISPASLQGRSLTSLNGTWQVGQGGLDRAPDDFAHTAPVPGLLSLADPPFDDIGVPSDARQAFWYSRTLVAPETAGEVTLLRVHKAKYGLAAFLDGEEIGRHDGAFTAATFQLPPLGDDHVLHLRVGATREVVDPSVPLGQDFEKHRFIPGLWDDVELISTGSPWISRVWLRPSLADASLTLDVETVHAPTLNREVYLVVSVSEVSGQSVGPVAEAQSPQSPAVTGSTTLTLSIPDPQPWTPETPFLYRARIEVRTPEGELVDHVERRFGMRDLAFANRTADAPAGFFLNGQRYYLRGSNISLHRFFEDAHCGALPWDEAWVRGLLSEFPKAVGWNIFRTSIGRLPRLWYDIADELGLLIADEFAMWTLLDAPAAEGWTAAAMATEFEAWMSEANHHASIAWWDACNETNDPRPGQAIDQVRPLDPTRHWENGGFNPPHAPGDPIEDHAYLFFPGTTNTLAMLDDNDGQPPQGGIPGLSVLTWDDPDHPYILNEYGWLWVNRDGTPTEVAAPVHTALLGSGPHSAEVHRETYAYVTGMLTEMWRAYRGYAGVLHFTHLGYSREGGTTSDNFVDVDDLVVEPRWRAYAESAFQPLMVAIMRFGDAHLESESLRVRVINDLNAAQTGTLVLSVLAEDGSDLTAPLERAFSVAALGHQEAEFTLDALPVVPMLLLAELTPDNADLPTVRSVRKLGFDHVGLRGPAP